MKKIDILIVDDSSSIRMGLKMLLEQNGYTVETNDSGEKMIEYLKSSIPELILLDIVFEDSKSGYDYCEMLKQDEKTQTIPIIFLTSLSDDDSLVRGLELGAEDFVYKNSNKKILLARIKSFFDNLELKKKLIEYERKSILMAASISASHHINQPLMLISGNVELLQMKIEKHKLENFQDLNIHITNILDALQRVTKIAEKMKNIKNVKLTKYAGQTDMVEL